MRKRIYEIVEVANSDDQASIAYDWMMIFVIVCSLIPLAFKTPIPAFKAISETAAVFFILDYCLRWSTADFKFGKGKLSFVLYPFTLMAIVDLLSILPLLMIAKGGLQMVRMMKMFRVLRVVRAFRAIRYSKSTRIIAEVFHHSKGSLFAVGRLAVGYIMITALVMFNIEPESFGSFFDAVYWACMSLTTVAYGDIYAVSTLGRIVTMISSVFGIAIIALPAGIITAGYMDSLAERRRKEEKLKKEQGE